MRMKDIRLLMVLLVAVAFSAGCYQMGKGVGKAANKVEQGARNFEQGVKDATQ